MLGKLVKHEFRATGRLVWLYFAGMLALSILMRICLFLFGGEQKLPDGLDFIGTICSGLLSILYFFGLFALCLAPLCISAAHFKRHVLGDEGYLTMTMPINIHSLIGSKLLVNLIWYLIAMVLGVLCISLTFFRTQNWIDVIGAVPDLFHWFDVMSGVMLKKVVVICIELVFLVALGVVMVTLLVYASLSIGHCCAKKRKELWSALLIYLFFHICGIAFMVFCLSSTGGDATPAVLEGMDRSTAAATAMEWFAGVGIVTEIILGAVFYFLTQRFLTRKLNLE